MFEGVTKTFKYYPHNHKQDFNTGKEEIEVSESKGSQENMFGKVEREVRRRQGNA